MPPGWISSVDDYARWVEATVATSGGVIPGGLVFNIWPLDESDDDSPALLDILPTRLFFHEGSFLDFSFQVDTDLTCFDYRFHFAATGGQMYWRKDMHDGHEQEDGGQCHIHCSTNERRPYNEVDFEEAIGEALRQLWDDPTYHPCTEP